MFLLPLDGGVRPLRVPPVGAFHKAPPCHVDVGRTQHVKWDGLGGRSKHNGAWLGFPNGLRIHVGEIPRIEFAFGHRHIISLLHKLGKLLVGHLGFVHPESIQRNLMRRPHIRLFAGLSHHKRAGGYPNHPLRRRLFV